MENTSMEYNSNKKTLVYPEYGRHIQSLIENAAQIEETKERQEHMEAIVHLIEQMNPNYRQIENSHLKIWQNIFNIIGPDVDLNYPDGIDRSPDEERYNKAHTLSYPVLNKKYRQHGGNVQKLLAKAMEMEDEEKKMEFLKIIGSYMKNVHRTWNNDNSVHDDVIKNEIKNITNGEIDLINSKIQFVDVKSNSSLNNNSRSSSKRSNKRSSNRKGGSKSSNRRRR